MPSAHRSELDNRLKDFDEVMSARDLICPAGAGRPAQRQGAALIRGSVVLLSAAFEAYVEELFDHAVETIFAAATTAERDQLKKNTSGRLNNADVFKVNLLFFNVGVPWILNDIRWQKFSNDSVRESINRMIERRNQIAHGRRVTVQKRTAKKWRNVVERVADQLDDRVADHILTHAGHQPW